MKRTGAVAGAFGKGSTSLPEIRHFSINETLQLRPMARFEEIHPGPLSQLIPSALQHKLRETYCSISSPVFGTTLCSQHHALGDR